MEILPEIQKRRSIRKFASTPLPEGAVDRIIEAGRRAPSAKNRQAWRFIAVTDGPTREKIQEAGYGQEYIGSAPLVIALCTTNVDYEMPNGQNSYPIDLGIAGAFMMLQAEHEGLGTCPITTFREMDVKVLLSVPHRMRIVLLLLVGVPDEDPELTRRFPTGRIAGFDHW